MNRGVAKWNCRPGESGEFYAIFTGGFYDGATAAENRRGPMADFGGERKRDTGPLRPFLFRWTLQ